MTRFHWRTFVAVIALVGIGTLSFIAGADEPKANPPVKDSLPPKNKETAYSYDPLEILKHPDLPKELPAALKERREYLNEALLTKLSLEHPYEGPLPTVIEILENLASPPESKNDPTKKVTIFVDEFSFTKMRGEKFDPAQITVKTPKSGAISLIAVLDIVCRQLDAEFRVTVNHIVIFPKATRYSDSSLKAEAYHPLQILKHPDLPLKHEGIDKRMDYLKKALLKSVDRSDPFEGPLPALIDVLEDDASPPEARTDPGKRVKILIDEISLSKSKGEKFEAHLVTIKIPKQEKVPLFVVIDQITRQMNAEFRVGTHAIEIFGKPTSNPTAVAEKRVLEVPAKFLIGR